MKKYLWEILGLVLFGFCIRKMFMLHIDVLLCVEAAGLFLLPVVNRCMLRTYETKAEYLEITTYMEQLLCSYKRFRKISLSLEDCLTLYSEKSRMGCVLRQMLHILRTGEGVPDKNITRVALAKLEVIYPSRRLRLLHEFVERAEQMGGDQEDALDILLCDLQMWKRRIILYQEKKQFIRIESVAAVGMALVLSCISIYLMPWTLRSYLTETVIFQCSTGVVIILLMVMEIVLLSRMTGTWLDCVEEARQKEQDRQQSCYKTVKSNRSGISGYVARRVCQKTVEKEFPYFLLAMSIHLQQEGVYQAVKLSQGHMDGIFCQELRFLMDQIYADPSSLQPYLSFFGELDMPELRTGMKLLYAVNSNSFTDSGRQIRFLAEQNHVVMDQCEKRRLDNQIAGMALLKHIPLIFACMKIILDMLLLLMLTMGKHLVL